MGSRNSKTSFSTTFEQSKTTVSSTETISSQKMRKSAKPVGVYRVIWILMNLILGSGILSIPKALQNSYIVLGLVVLVIVCTMCDYVCSQLIKMGEIKKVYSFEKLAEVTFGKWMYFAICIFCFLFDFGAMVGYASAIHSAIHRLYLQFISQNAVSSKWGPIGITFGLFLVFVFPWSYQKNISSLSWLSMASVVTFGVIAVFVTVAGIRTPNYPSNFRPLSGIGFLQAFGALLFSFVCTDSIFPIYCDLKDPTPARWDKVVHITLFSLGVLYAVFSIICYFLVPYLDDYVLNSISIIDLPEINIAKLLLVITLLLTHLSNVHVSRAYVYAIIEKAIVPISKIPKTKFRILHVAVTTITIIVTVILGIILNDLLFIINLTGLVSSTAVGFIIPSLIIFNVKTVKVLWNNFKDVFRTKKIPIKERCEHFVHFILPIIIFIFGVIGFAIGTPLTIINFIKSE